MAIYLDNAATTKVREEVLEKMLPYFLLQFGNPSSLHTDGLSAKKALSEARKSLAEELNCKANEIFFTSCGTESDNWAIKGFLEANPTKGNHVITSMVEHHAVLETCEYLEKHGYEVTYLPVNALGVVEVDQLRRAIRPETALITVMTVNNETGAIQPVEEIAELAREKGICFHTDAVQAAGHLKMDASKVDMLSLSGHKFGGPKGVGLLYIREGIRVAPLLHGGGQEQRLRSGTENVPSVVGMSHALQLANRGLSDTQERWKELRAAFTKRLLGGLEGVTINGGETGIPSTINVSFQGVEASAILVFLDLKEIRCSGGSACTSSRNEPSHVLSAMGVGEDMIRGSIRLSMSIDTTMEEMMTVADVMIETVTKLRAQRAGKGM